MKYFNRVLSVFFIVFAGFQAQAQAQAQAQEAQRTSQEPIVVAPKAEVMSIEGFNSHKVRTRKAVINAGSAVQFSRQNQHAEKVQGATVSSVGLSQFDERRSTKKNESDLVKPADAK